MERLRSCGLALANETFGAHGSSAAEIVALPIDHIDPADRAISTLQIKPIGTITAADDTLHVEFIRITIAIHDRDAPHFNVIAACRQPNSAETAFASPHAY
jgi:hypothetical protein